MVMQIPITRSSSDFLIWAATRDGILTTKSAYHFICHQLQVGRPSSSLGCDRDGLWRDIWKLKSIPRCKDMAWRICHGFLPTTQCLARRGVQLEPVCPMCGEDEESIAHALIFCPQVSPIWFMSSLSMNFSGPQPDNFTMEHWLASLLDQGDDWVTDKVLTLLYAVWARRNLWVFYHRWLTMEQTLIRVAAMEVVALDSSVGDAHDLLRGERQDKWKGPAVGIAKINTDAAFKAGAAVGMGMVVRNAAGEVLASASGKRGGADSAAVAEAMALRWSLELALDMGFQAVVVETDCAVLHGAWNVAASDRSYMAAVIRDCVDLSRLFRSFEFLLIHRTANLVADFLAKFALSSFCNVWLEEYPPGLEGILISDVSSSSS
ncbi:uncharacterized protein LOC130744990 [Lotus japonicus]|uniref:uncharacterized protein LOC130744990 n=1 Tax=Lotus japonicus TaxID=34305 RepID=UPI0025868492|nr:uncharacterized protein LOC130744990 [Lotus japonicus]